MTSTIIQFLLSALVIVIAGGALTQFGEIISHRTKLGGMMVGGILIAGATSLPELAININVVRLGAADLAVGSLVGSNLFNLLILAVCDLTRYSRGTLLSKTSAQNALAAAISIGLVGIAAIFIFLGSELGDRTFLRAGPGSFVLVIAYVIGFRLIYVVRVISPKREGSQSKDIDSVLHRLRKTGLKGGIAGFVAAALMILLSAPFMANAADSLARETGLGGTFVGSVFVGLSTSLPEVVTVFSAIRMKSFDIGIGNIFGSNCFNILLIAPLDFVFQGSILSAAASTHIYTSLSVIVVTTVVILGQLYNVEKKKPFLEPDAWMAILMILGAFIGLYFVR